VVVLEVAVDRVGAGFEAGGDRVPGAEHLGAVVVAHAVGPSAGDDRQRPALERQGERVGVDVAGAGEHVVDEHRTAGEHSLDPPVGEPADRVEVVGVHVLEDRAEMAR